jgi:hypothetical protein
VSRLHESPLADDLEAAREGATDDVVDMAHGRRRRVLATRIPGGWRERKFRAAVAQMFTDMDLEVGDVG